MYNQERKKKLVNCQEGNNFLFPQALMKTHMGDDMFMLVSHALCIYLVQR